MKAVVRYDVHAQNIADDDEHEYDLNYQARSKELQLAMPPSSQALPH